MQLHLTLHLDEACVRPQSIEHGAIVDFNRRTNWDNLLAAGLQKNCQVPLGVGVFPGECTREVDYRYGEGMLRGS